MPILVLMNDFIYMTKIQINTYEKKHKARPTHSCWELYIMHEISMVPVSCSLMAISALAIQCKNHSSTWAYSGLGLIVNCQLTVVAYKGRQREQCKVWLLLGPKTQKSFCSEEPVAEASIWCDTSVLVYWVRKRWLYLYTGYTLCSSETNARVTVHWVQENSMCFERWLLHANDILCV